MTIIARSFFQRDPVTCSRELVGCELVWNDCGGIIVETEAYSTVGDEACHTFMRPSARDFVARHSPGTAYVYFNYGMYWLLNVLVKGGAQEGFVLLRALEPTRGLDLMAARRGARRPKQALLPPALCSGPGKLTIALGITGNDHGRDLCTSGEIGFRAGSRETHVVPDVRIGISKATHLPWRFLERDSRFVSASARASTADP
ncbi:MAG: DNA-3-methyladenine glycosylase [Verrucomicrobiota bacterium]|nr:DNA-3-methyladenine glycosylase [Verrucomicrobiota bacterium]